MLIFSVLSNVGDTNINKQHGKGLKTNTKKFSFLYYSTL